jgi:hypothetical protein
MSRYLCNGIITFQGAIVFLTLGFLLFAKWQLDEIWDSSKDTKAIAEAAKQQATNTKTLAEAAKNQAQAALQQATARRKLKPMLLWHWRNLLKSQLRPHRGVSTSPNLESR